MHTSIYIHLKHANLLVIQIDHFYKKYFDNEISDFVSWIRSQVNDEFKKNQNYITEAVIILQRNESKFGQHPNSATTKYKIQ